MRYKTLAKQCCLPDNANPPIPPNNIPRQEEVTATASKPLLTSNGSPGQDETIQAIGDLEKKFEE